MANNKEEENAYLRTINDYLSTDTKIGEEFSFVSNRETITIIRTQEFEDAFDLLEKTNHNIFLTGKAGTGKSTLIKYFRSKSAKQTAILSFTGLAALNIGGETIHSFFQFPIGFIDKKTVHANNKISHILRGISTIILDEVSMIRADLMDAIDKSLQKNRENNLPFGGVQMIFIGDLHQLPPIVEKELRQTYGQFYKTPFFFSADVFTRKKIKKIDLQKVHRQTNPLFLEVLNDVRENKFTDAAVKILNRNVVDNKFMHELLASDYVVLCTLNEKARTINNHFMDKLNTPIHNYKAKIGGDFDPATFPTDEVLRFKEGAKVIFIRNDTELKSYVNGDVGIIRRLTPNSILVESDKAMITVERCEWHKYRYETKYVDSVDENGIAIKKRIVTKVVAGTFSQYPLKLGWAISIHKSQGQTYEKVVIDFGDGCFTSGQAYVALSRCRTIEGIKLRRPMRVTDVILDRRIYGIDNIIDNDTEDLYSEDR